MSKVNWAGRSREDFLHWFIISAITDSRKIDEIMAQEGFDASNLEVKFFVNGFELPVEETIESINKQLDRMVEEKAIELLNERVCDLDEILEDFKEKFDDGIKRLLRK